MNENFPERRQGLSAGCLVMLGIVGGFTTLGLCSALEVSKEAVEPLLVPAGLLVQAITANPDRFQGYLTFGLCVLMPASLMWAGWRLRVRKRIEWESEMNIDRTTVVRVISGNPIPGGKKKESIEHPRKPGVFIPIPAFEELVDLYRRVRR